MARLAAVTRTCLITALLLAVVGCGTATTSQPTARPTVRIVSPIRGAKLSTQTVTVHLSISHFTLIPGPAGLEQAGSGQVWVYANGRIESRLGSATATLGLRPGTYTLKAVLVTNGRAVASSSPIVVSIMPASTPSTSTSGGLPPISCATSPMPSSGLKAGTITLFCKGLPAGGVGNDLMVGPSGALWFTTSALGSGTNAIVRVTTSGVITVFSQRLSTFGYLGGLTAGPNSTLWFTGNSLTGGTVGIGRLTPSGAITVFSHGMPAGDYVSGLVPGPGGDLWFIVSPTVPSPGNPGIVGIGRVTPSGAITVFSHGLPAGDSVSDLVTGPGGDLWFTACAGSCTVTAEIGRITASGAITVFSHGLPAGGGVVGNLVKGPDGNLWFPVNGGIGRITPSGTITVYSEAPLAGRVTGSWTIGPDGNMWFAIYPKPTNAGGNGAIGIARVTASGSMTVFTRGLPAGSLEGGNSDPAGSGAGELVVGPDGSLWFTVTPYSANAGTVGIGRITPSGVITVFSSQALGAGGAGWLVAGPDGNLWFTGGGGIGRITPSGAVTVFNSPALTAGGGVSGGKGSPSLVSGPDGNLWFLVPTPGTCCGPNVTNAIGRIVP